MSLRIHASTRTTLALLVAAVSAVPSGAAESTAAPVIRGGHAVADVRPGIRVAHSAMIFNVNRQTDGWATLGVY